MTDYKTSRRRFLRGVSTILPLPLLEAFLPRVVYSSETVPGRMITIFNPHGPANEFWYPSGYGENYKLSPTLKSLERHRKELTVFSGLCHPRYPANAGHSILRERHIKNTLPAMFFL